MIAGGDINPMHESADKAENFPDGDGDGVVHMDEEEQVEAVPMRMVRAPDDPTASEVEQHRIAHIPYRSWCRECVLGRGISAAHAKLDAEREHLLPTVAHDYAFVGKDDDKVMPVLVSKSSRSLWIDAAVMPCKGSTSDYAVEHCADAILRMGHARFISKVDQENAAKDLVSKTLSKLGTRVEAIPENPPVNNSASNGMIENGVKQIEGIIRTHRSAVEHSQGVELSTDSHIIPWLVLWASYLYNRFSLDVRGRTPYEKTKGKRFKRELLEFGERVWWMPMKKEKKKNKLADKFREGHFLGIKEGTDEAFIGTPEGVVKTRTIKRMPTKQRKSGETLLAVRGVPWQPNPGGTSTKVEIEVQVDPIPVPAGVTVPDRIDVEDAKVKLSRRNYIRQADLDEHGYTVGCPGCDAIQNGTARRGHNGFCSDRIESELSKTEDGQRRLEDAKRRKDLEFERQVAAEENRRRGVGSSSTRPHEFVGLRAELGSDSTPHAAATGVEMDTTTPKEVRVREEAEAEGASAQLVKKLKANPGKVKTRVAEIESDIAESSTKKAKLAESASDMDVTEQQPRPTESSSSTAETDEQVMEDVQKMLGSLAYDVDVSELFNPKRFLNAAASLGLSAGDAFDMSQPKPDGEHWDFDKVEDRKLARLMLKEKRPLLLIGSPMCKMFSTIMSLNIKHWSKEEYERKLLQATVHLRFCFELYEWQANNGRFWLHEHPDKAWSWKLDFVQELMQRPDTIRVTGDQCPFGLTSVDFDGSMQLAVKPTGWATNSARIAEQVGIRCSNIGKEPWQQHRHVPLIGGRAKSCEVYPPRLVRAILRGLCAEMKDRGMIHSGEIGSVFCEEKECNWEEYREEQEQNEVTRDAVTGIILDPALVYAAKMEELRTIRQFGVYAKVPISECVKETGKQPIGVTWVVVNKGDAANPDIRARLVAQEFKFSDPERDDVFAPTPPVEGLRLLISFVMTQTSDDDEPEVVEVLDATRAHFHSPASRKLYVKLCKEDAADGQCGLLGKSMYGTRDAAANWESFSRDVMIRAGFIAGKASPCLLYHPVEDVKAYKHGDDFVLGGKRDKVKKLSALLSKEIQLKSKGVLGPRADLGDIQEVRVLNRLLRYTVKEGVNTVEWEPDPRHAELILRGLGLDDKKAKSLSSPGDKKAEAGGDQPLVGNEIKQFRSLTMRANFLAEDRCDLKFACKELARHMAKPTQAAWSALRKLGRYLIGAPRVVQEYRMQRKQRVLFQWCDSNYAGCTRTRKSTNAGMLMHGCHLIRGYSTTQAVPALSSGEAEFYSVVKATASVLGSQSLAADLGQKLQCEVGTDSSAAKAMALRQGLGKARHIHTSLLWIQQIFSEKKAVLRKVDTKKNLADVGTKFLDGPQLWQLLETAGFRRKAGHSKMALRAQT